MKNNSYKKFSEMAAWDLDKGCKNIINQASPGNRRLKKKIRRSDRKRLDRTFQKMYNIDTERSGYHD